MTVEALTSGLKANLARFRTLLIDVEPAEAHWKGSDEQWSLVEIAAHLADEEREDFRARLSLLLSGPGREWPGIDPMGWVASRRYAERELGAVVRELVEERETSLAWLADVPEPDWSREHAAAGAAGPGLRAGDLAASWLAHDYFHLRHMTTVRWKYLNASVFPFSTEYAGTIEEAP